MQVKPMAGTRVTYEYTVKAADLNHYGIMHGGRLLTLADETGYLAAHGHAGWDCLTLGVNRARFYQPAHDGDVLTFSAQVALTGNTSLWVPVSADLHAHQLVMEAVIIFVAVDQNMQPSPVPQVEAGTDAEQQLQFRMRKLRDQMRETP